MVEQIISCITIWQDRRPRGIAASPRDVFVIVRQWLSDPPEICQDPLMVYPAAFGADNRAWLEGLSRDGSTLYLHVCHEIIILFLSSPVVGRGRLTSAHFSSTKLTL